MTYFWLRTSVDLDAELKRIAKVEYTKEERTQLRKLVRFVAAGKFVEAFKLYNLWGRWYKSGETKDNYQEYTGLSDFLQQIHMSNGVMADRAEFYPFPGFAKSKKGKK